MSRRPIALAAGAIASAALSIAATAARPDPHDVAGFDGAQLFHVKGCAMCHNAPGVDAMIGVGPSLAHAPNWASTRVAGMSAEDYLAQSMTQPAAVISPAFTGGVGPSNAMPPLQLSTAEVDALVTFLLHPPEATPGSTS